ncbi:MAG: nucleotidyltransferase family protein [Bacteroidota bacterium]
MSGYDLTAHLNDLDLVYFDGHDLSYEAEDRYIRQAHELFKHLPIRVEVRNQARVHLWYERHFGYPIEPYRSVEEAINTWLTTATCVGVRYQKDTFSVYAPYGLNDLFGMIVRPNKLQITEEIYLNKVKRWKQCWPKLQIVPW